MTKRLQTVDEIIDAFGGSKKPAEANKAVAVWLGLNTSAICNWRERQSIPSGWHLRFYLEAGRRGMEIDPRVFGIDDGPTRARQKKQRGARARVEVPAA